MATRGDIIYTDITDISTKYLYIIYRISESLEDNLYNIFSKNPLVGVFSVVKVKIFGFLIFSRDRNIFCEIRFNFCAPGHSTVISI